MHGHRSAWLYSVIARVLPGMFPSDAPGMGGAVPVYFEAAAHYRPGAPRPGAGATSPRADVGRHKGAAGAGAQDRAAYPRRRFGRGGRRG